MTSKFWFSSFTATALLVAASVAQAAETKSLGSFGDWEAYSYGSGGGKICYMASLPKSSKGGPPDRGDTYVTVTHRPSENSTNVVSVVAGYSYKKGSEVIFNIDGRDHEMFTQGDGAWLKTAADDEKVVRAMIRGLKLVVRGTPDGGADSVDTYSLRGFTDAHNAIGKACGVR